MVLLERSRAKEVYPHAMREAVAEASARRAAAAAVGKAGEVRRQPRRAAAAAVDKTGEVRRRRRWGRWRRWRRRGRMLEAVEVYPHMVGAAAVGKAVQVRRALRGWRAVEVP